MARVRREADERSYFLQPRYGFPESDARKLNPEKFAYQDRVAREYAEEGVRRRANWMFVSVEDLLRDKNKLKKLVRRGIPAELRPALWMQLAGADDGPGKEPSKSAFQALVDDRSTEYMDRSNRKAILKDADRTFVRHPFFASPDAGGQEALRRCLLAFVHHEPEIGYIQPMSRVVAFMLLFYARDERKAFWLFETAVTKVLPPDFYHKRLVGVQVAGQVFARLLQLYAPEVHAHMNKHGVQPRHVVVPWFSSLFVGVLRDEVCARVWDCMMLEGSKIMYRVALAMIIARKEVLLRVTGQGPLHNAVSTIGRSFLNPDELLDCAFGIANLSRHAIEQLRRQWLDHVVREMRDAGIEEPDETGATGSTPARPDHADADDAAQARAEERAEERRRAAAAEADRMA